MVSQCEIPVCCEDLSNMHMSICIDVMRYVIKIEHGIPEALILGCCAGCHAVK